MEPNTTNQGSSQTAPAGKKVVIWAEDDQLLGKILGDAIVNHGFELKMALTGKEAIDLLKEFTPDVLMVDLYLPGELTGYDILENAYANPKLENVPTIILSNFSQAEHFGKENPAQPTKYLLKADVSIGQIISTLDEMCGG
jgi:CheY-like chemotaxis protein